MRILKYRKTDRPTRRSAASATRSNVGARRSCTSRKGDTVRVMRGDDKGQEGKVIRVFPKTGRVTVEGINIVKRHRKARARRGAERDHRDAGADPSLERDAARSEGGRADADATARIDEDGTKERHQP